MANHSCLATIDQKSLGFYSYDISHAQFVILAGALWATETHQELFQAYLIEQSKLDKMTVSKSLKKLAEQGLVKRLEHKTDTRAKLVNLTSKGQALAKFLKALQAIDSTNGPMAGAHNFFRGGSLAYYDHETRRAIHALENQIDHVKAIQVWEEALATQWQKLPVWVYGDISAGNLLVQEGRLSAVIDFGQLAIGDPACDCAFAWTYFTEPHRSLFLNTLEFDEDTYARARAWALWKALIVAAGFTQPNNVEAQIF